MRSSVAPSFGFFTSWPEVGGFAVREVDAQDAGIDAQARGARIRASARGGGRPEIRSWPRARPASRARSTGGARDGDEARIGPSLRRGHRPFAALVRRQRPRLEPARIDFAARSLENRAPSPAVCRRATPRRNPPPPIPLEVGLVTPATSAAVTAASTALPPARSCASASRVASSFSVAAASAPRLATGRAEPTASSARHERTRVRMPDAGADSRVSAGASLAGAKSVASAPRLGEPAAHCL